MISKYDLKKAIENHDPNTMWFNYDTEKEMLKDKESGEDICTLDTYLIVVREKTGQSFENVYDEHVSLSWVIKCTKCGCVLFGGDDERYEPSLKCPVCTDYKPHSTEFWTSEEITKDVKKQNTIKLYKDMQQSKIDSDKRREKRNGKYDWQIWNKTKKINDKFILCELECNNITESYFKGLRFKITFSKDITKDDDGNVISWTRGKRIIIPLSWSAFYIQFIYKHKTKLEF